LETDASDAIDRGPTCDRRNVRYNPDIQPARVADVAVGRGGKQWDWRFGSADRADRTRM